MYILNNIYNFQFNFELSKLKETRIHILENVQTSNLLSIYIYIKILFEFLSCFLITQYEKLMLLKFKILIFRSTIGSER